MIAKEIPALHVPEILRRYGLHPRKSLGQNFLMDEHWLARVADIAGIDTDDTVLEVGAGLGSLTRHLGVRARRVLAVEVDRWLLPILREVMADYPTVQVVEGDILELSLEQLVGDMPVGSFRVAANIPYYITSAVIRRLLEMRLPPVRIVLTVQQEVAQRICATPGDMNLLALSVQYYGTPAIVGAIPAAAFYPAPNVESAIVCVDMDPAQPRDLVLSNQFFKLARAGFSMKRKMLRNTLAAGMHLSSQTISQKLESVGIEATRRAETVSVEEWMTLARLDWAAEE
jgi:16S rRNA (adenine1518-N6/adenine1519-N6)-dimethyltransferase